jgi:hypothetical protein
MECIRLTLNENVLLEAMLFHASKSQQLKKSRKTGRMLFAAIMIMLGGLLLYFSRLIGVTILIVGTIVFILFPKYLAWYYRLMMSKAIKNGDLKKRVGQSYDINFDQEYLEIKNPQVEVKHYYSNFENITETNSYFYVKIEGAEFLIFPKAQIPDHSSLKAFFENLCRHQKIAYYEEYNWKWS